VSNESGWEEQLGGRARKNDAINPSAMSILV